jgi:Na+-transporting methylmalonyl-CoA/oxaloacetate decarboxylase gamma subunit
MGERWNRFMGRVERKFPALEQKPPEVAKTVQPPEPEPMAVIPKIKRALKRKKKR